MLPIFDNLLGLRARQNQDLRRERRILRENSDPFDLPENRFIELYRLNKDSVHNLIRMLRPHLHTPAYAWGITCEAKIFTALRFYATGCYQRAIGEQYQLGLSQTSVHRCVHELICDPNLCILNVNANFPGSTHDSFIWRQSRIKQFLHGRYINGMRNVWLIGDSGYPLEQYLMTPFADAAEGSPEFRYNGHHARARNCIERCIGVLKMRLRCILKERTARYSPQFIGRLFNTCAVLHNICVNAHVPLMGEALDPVAENINVNNHIGNHVPHEINDLNEARQIRQNIVTRYFQG
ncbi:hypothetical protein NQ315_000627 [Exocentrus adspersus]|uniref:DDE Tnp4 domain-containing protein n=1 Tax=Exocentrus adspersus TaxID=1586481 RepID=A0AAV8VMZ1_9CUCU|nr:hypothetical protein NQ315_000627 [Exocentrus adspersus]